jgi:hypothetical protein
MLNTRKIWRWLGLVPAMYVTLGAFNLVTFPTNDGQALCLIILLLGCFVSWLVSLDDSAWNDDE